MPRLFERNIAAIADDDVIQQWNAHEFSRFGDPGGEGNIIVARRWVAAGVVVAQNDAGAAMGERLAKDFPGVRGASRQRADREDANTDDLVSDIEEDRGETFLPPVSEVLHEQRSRVASVSDDSLGPVH